MKRALEKVLTQENDYLASLPDGRQVPWVTLKNIQL